jgi:ABC-type transport system involved in multi-copper enzyme maturation permease subunit
MLHLLKIEWLKVKNYRTFWIIFLLFLVSIIGANYITHEFQQMIFAKDVKHNPSDAIVKMFLGTPPYSFPQVWQMVSQVTSYLLIIPGLLTIILFTNEFSYKTHRQNVIDGMSRTQFITSKLLYILVIAVISTLMVVVTTLIFGYAGDKPFSTDKMYYVGYSFLQNLNYCLFALLIGVVFKRSGISIGVYFLYVVILENIIDIVLNKYVNNTGYFLPVESADSLVTAPIFETLQKQFLTRPDPKYILIACSIYILLFILLSYRKFQKDDL